MADTVEDLLAKQAITEILYRYPRALDRMDREMALSCWHKDGTDDHAPLYSGSAAGFIEWLWPVHAAMEVTRHVVSNITIEVDGDRAGTECYWTVTLRTKGDDGTLYDIQGQGRYVDHFEKIGGIWAIRHRQSMHDWDRVAPVTMTMADAGAPRLIEPHNPEVAPKHWARDRTDYSYQVLKRRYG